MPEPVADGPRPPAPPELPPERIARIARLQAEMRAAGYRLLPDETFRKLARLLPLPADYHLNVTDTRSSTAIRRP
ncbi:MAG: hypothetical protein FWE15_04710 [Actinomycetia bacterium]|nr:hypothetical protein [Actinomycetes bacterium]